MVDAIRFDFSELGEVVNSVFRQVALPALKWDARPPRANLFTEFAYYVNGVRDVISMAIYKVQDALMDAHEVPDGWEEPYPPFPVRCPKDLFYWVDGELKTLDEARSRGRVSIYPKSQRTPEEPESPEEAWNRIRFNNWWKRMRPVYFNARQSLMAFRRDLKELAPKSPKNLADAYDRLSAFRQRLEKEGFRIADQESKHTTIGSNGTPASSEPKQKNTPFTNGVVVFREDRVELSGAIICQGARARSKRIILELLSLRTDSNEFVCYSLKKLTETAQRYGVTVDIAALIRHVRKAIEVALVSQGFSIPGDQVILTTRTGYQFSNKLSVQFIAPPTIRDIRDKVSWSDVPNRGVPNVESKPRERQAWILQRLREGKATDRSIVAAEFQCDTKTAQRDFQALKKRGEIKRVGGARMGHYELVDPDSSLR